MWYSILMPKILSMSLTASVVIAAVLLARLALKRAPKVFSYALWAVALFRLLCPVAPQLPVSVIPQRLGSGEIVQRWTGDYAGGTELMHSGAEGYDEEIKNGALPVEAGGNHAVTAGGGSFAPQTVKSAWLQILSYIWLAGVAGLFFYSVLSLLRLRKRLVGAALLRENIYIADHIDSPFVMGLFRPKIYLPSALSEREREYIIMHERYHIRRCDHVVKLVFFAALCIHWFNPLVWLAFVMSGRDMEMSCDEAVLGKMGGDIRADYSASLLRLATGRRMIAGAPLAFGEGDPEGRIKNVLSFKKPTVWIIIAAAVICAAVVILCAVNPKTGEKNEPVNGEMKLTAGEIYTSGSCIYMNPLSSFFPTDGDSGYRYVMGEGSFTLISRADESERSISPVIWGWQELPWTKQQWSELFAGGEEVGMVSLEDYDRLLYQPLSDELCLIKADGQLWLVEIREISKMGKQVWSIYTLEREGRAEAADFKPEDIHDLSSAELQMVYGSFELTDAESLSWLEEELGTAEEIVGGVDSTANVPIYLTRSDGVTGVVYLADNNWAVFKSGESWYGWSGNDGTELWELFGAEREHTETVYNEAGQKLKETRYDLNSVRSVIENEYDAEGKLLKTVSTNSGGSVYSMEREYENGLPLRTVYRENGEPAGSEEYVCDKDGDVIIRTALKADGTVSSVVEYVYGYVNGEKLQTELTQTAYPENERFTQRFEYNDKGQRIGVKGFDADGAQTFDKTIEYDDAGNVAAETTYDVNGELIRKVVYEYEYDENGNQTYVNQYDGNGNLITRTRSQS